MDGWLIREYVDILLPIPIPRDACFASREMESSGFFLGCSPEVV